MSTVTKPIMKDETGQDLVAEAQNIVLKLQDLINAVKPTATDIPLAAISGMTADDVQEGVAELKSNLTDLNNSLTQLNDSNLHSLTSESASVVINRGGYLQLGDMVIVSVKITLSATVGASTKILSGFPAVNDGFALPMMSLNHTDSLRMSLSNAYTNQSTASGEYWITGAYITY